MMKTIEILGLVSRDSNPANHKKSIFKVRTQLSNSTLSNTDIHHVCSSQPISNTRKRNNISELNQRKPRMSHHFIWANFQFDLTASPKPADFNWSRLTAKSEALLLEAHSMYGVSKAQSLQIVHNNTNGQASNVLDHRA